jgi:hypothetical protein
MANAILFKRTKDNPKSSHTVAQLPASQKLEFNATTQITESNTMNFANQIVAKPSPTNDGTRLIKIQDNGASDISFQVRGYIKIDSNDTNIKKLINFAKEVQVEVSTSPHANDHKYGKFGLEYPNSSRLGFDPLPTAGLSIRSLVLAHQPQGKVLNFEMALQFGGTYTALT